MDSAHGAEHIKVVNSKSVCTWTAYTSQTLYHLVKLEKKGQLV